MQKCYHRHSSKPTFNMKDFEIKILQFHHFQNFLLQGNPSSINTITADVYRRCHHTDDRETFTRAEHVPLWQYVPTVKVCFVTYTFSVQVIFNRTSSSRTHDAAIVCFTLFNATPQTHCRLRPPTPPPPAFYM